MKETMLNVKAKVFKISIAYKNFVLPASSSAASLRSSAIVASVIAAVSATTSRSSLT
jgi:hypothetical protein